MRMAAQSTKPQPKQIVSAASKISRVVTDFFLPLADDYIPAYTPFTATPDVEETLILERLWEVFPDCMKSRETFVAKMGELYDNSKHNLTTACESPPDQDLDKQLPARAKRSRCKT